MNEQHATMELLLRYVDGTLPAQERFQVEELLRQDVRAREMFRDIATQAVVIADVARMADQTQMEINGAGVGKLAGRMPTWQRVGLTVAAALFVAIILSQLLWLEQRQAEIVTINDLSGPMVWIGDGGRVTEKLVVGKKLSGGTIELLSADSWIEFEFQDQSTVTLSGQSEVTISEQLQKELHLRYGSLSASVAPQPADHPLLVHTPFNELQVLGTQFNVETLSGVTRLVVNEGSVRLKRLSDGQELVVPARHEVTSSSEDLDGLPLTERATAVSVWTSDLKEDVVCGKWIPELKMFAMRLKRAVARGEMSEAEATQEYKDAVTLDDEIGSVWAETSPYGSLIVLAVARPTEPPVLLGTNTKVCLTGRSFSRVSVKFGMTTQQIAGMFAGKYSFSLSAAELAGNDGEFKVEVPLSKFREETNFGDSPVGKELTDWWCVAGSTSAKVEITGVELIE